MSYSTFDFFNQVIDKDLEDRVAMYRLNRLREQIINFKLDAVVLFEPINIRYACGVRNMQVYSQRNPARYLIVPAEGPVALFEYRSCAHLTEGVVTLDEVHPASPIMPLHSGDHSHRHVQSFITSLKDILSRSTQNFGRIGIESAPTELLADTIKAGFDVIDASRPIEVAKSIKSLDELTLIARSVTLTERAMSVLEGYLKPGITENEAWAVFNKEVLATGGEYAETRLFASGDRTNPWFQECSDKIMNAGELVAFDTDTVGIFGYYTDFSRTFVIPGKEATPTQKALYQLSSEELETNIALMKPGMSFKEYSQKAWKIPKEYQKNRYLAVVHGCGMTGEWPIISHNMDWDEVGYDGIIQPGMTLCVESYIGREYGEEGVKLEEQVLVTETGVRRMSSYGYSNELLN
ncbi:M24 family metallopeptidase [Marinomonas foliarum]|uniref:Xaa-Pro aminopeptidase n=1 Tax=Marinomonas foliarum TaxID=491950 RepID=A0A369AHH3_9GAMM|nr:Xaa-Pro peptidase family protein [Marinomonas foliarum]RCX07798.1 Xaa-Pro aminopeptidase [Marinomonas foliarum]